MAKTLIHQHSRKYWPWLFLLLVLVVSAMGWWLYGRDQSGQAAVQPGAAENRSAWPMATSSSDDNNKLLFSKEPVGEAKPPDFSQEAWDTLNKALATAANKDQERNRLVSYLRFQRAVSKWGEMSSGPVTAERRALAGQVVKDMPEHIANGEVNPAEAMIAITAMAADVEPDEAKRSAWIDEQRERFKQTQTPEQIQAVQEDEDKRKRFEAEKAQITQRWMSSHEPSSDPATLAEQIDALRARVYGSTTPATP